MPKYLFSNDQRISALVERIQWVADYVMSGKNLKIFQKNQTITMLPHLNFTIIYIQIQKIQKLQ